MSRGDFGYKKPSVRPPMLNGSNYAFWKTRMTAYIRGMDDRAWRNVLVGWKPPQVEDENGNLVYKDELSWTTEEDKLSAANSRALNAIFAAVEPDIYALIQQCTVAKDAWDFLQDSYEGTDKVKESKMQLLTSRFERLKMGETESVTAYNSRLMTISNEAHALGEPISMEKLVKKALRTLNSKFVVHKITLSQMHDLKTLTLPELMGELVSYECDMEAEDPPKKSKNFALKGQIVEDESESEDDQMALLSKQFGRFLKTMKKKKKKKKNSETSQNNNRTDPKPFRGYPAKSGENFKPSDKGKGIQCHECEGYGHVQRECPNFLRKQKKSLIAHLSDSDSEKDEDNQLYCLALTATTDVPESSQTEENDLGSGTDTEITDESIAERYKALFANWEKLRETNMKLKADKAVLIQENKKITDALSRSSKELASTKVEVLRLTRFLKMMTKGTNQIDEMLSTQRDPRNKTGLGFERQVNRKKGPFDRNERIVLNDEAETLATWTKDTRTCDHCKKPGHIQRKWKDFLKKYRRRVEREEYVRHPVKP